MKSNLKFTSFLLVLTINFLVGILFWTVFVMKEISVFEFEFWKNRMLILSFIMFLEILALSLLFNLREIIIEKNKVIFKNLLFPFIKKERLFTYYDFSKFVDQHTKTGLYESLWLFKNGKLEDQISSFNYSNYTKLKFELKVRNKGKLKITTFKQIYLRLGGKL